MAKPNRVECPFCHKKVAIDKKGKLCVHSDFVKQGLCPNSGLTFKTNKK